MMFVHCSILTSRLHLTLILISILISVASPISYNLPWLCPNATWAPNGTMIYDLRGPTGQEPHALFINRRDELFLPLSSNNTLLVRDRQGSSCQRSFVNTSISGRAIFVGGYDDIYLASNNNNNKVIYRLFPNDTIIRIPYNYSDPCYGLWVDSSESSLYCSVLEKFQVIKTSIGDTNGSHRETIAASITLQKPQGLFMNTDLVLYVANTDNHTIRVFNVTNPSTPVATYGPSLGNLSLNKPTSVILDADNHLYVADNQNHRIVAIDPRTNKSRCIIACTGGKGSALNQLDDPVSLAFDSLGNIYVTDKGNRRLLKFDYQSNSCGSTSTPSSESTAGQNVGQAWCSDLSTETSTWFHSSETARQSESTWSASTDASIVTYTLTDTFPTTSTLVPMSPCTDSGLIGTHCHIPVDPCALLHPCLNSGSCFNNFSLPQLFNCYCTANYTGIYCQVDLRVCQPNTCLYEGTCIPLTSDDYRCLCTSDRTGSRCETKIDFCENVACQNHGQCQSTSTGAICRCLSEEYSGTYCEFAPTRIVIRQVITRTVGYIAVLALISVALFTITMDILKYGFGIGPKASDKALAKETGSKRNLGTSRKKKHRMERKRQTMIP